MKGIGILLIIVGIVGLILAGMMFGDIGISASIGSVTALLAGFGFIKVAKMGKEETSLEEEKEAKEGS